MLHQKWKHAFRNCFRLILVTAIYYACAAEESGCNILAETPTVGVRRVDSWKNLFAGMPASIRCEVVSQQVGEATLRWSLTASGAVIARGDKPVTLAKELPVEVCWDVELPEIKPGLIVAAKLRLQIEPQDGSPKFEASEEIVELSIFSRDATANRDEWLMSLDIVLFDPAKRLSGSFEKSRIPFQPADDPQCSNLAKGLIVYGEGIEASRLGAVWSSALEAVAGGRRVLMLASPGAVVPVEGLVISSTDSLQSITVRRDDIIRDFDKRFDGGAWPKPGRLAMSSLHWATRGDQPCVEIRDDAAGWMWLDVRHRSGGRLIWSGFGLAESWEVTPTPRYLMLKVLEDLKADKPLFERD